MRIKNALYKAMGLIMCLSIAFGFAFSMAGCKKNGEQTETPPPAPPAAAISLNENNLKLDVNSPFTLIATLSGISGTVVWSSSNEYVAVVDQNGVVTGISDGEATIYATVGENRASCFVTVEEGMLGLPVFAIDAKSQTIYVGYTTTLGVVFRIGKEEQTIADGAVTWNSDSDCATVRDGEVTGAKAGTANITASYVYEGTTYSSSVSVRVRDIAAYVMDIDKGVLGTKKTYGGKVNPNASTQIRIDKLTGGDSTVSVTDFSAFEFSCDNEDVATVDENGVVTAGDKAGVATISASNEETTMQVSVTTKLSIASKFDLDMLALAYARGTNSADWGANAYYMLTQDIDYDGAPFIPIASCDNKGIPDSCDVLIGKQWKDILSEGNEYGITYEQFKEKGLIRKSSGTVAPITFRGTIDGNGYAVKNAKLMRDAFVQLNGTGSNFVISSTNVIGAMDNGAKVCNIAFENLTVQSWKDAGYGESTTSYAFDVLNSQSTKTLNLRNGANQDKFVAFGFIGLMYGDNNRHIENVYVDFSGDNVLGIGANNPCSFAGKAQDNSIIIYKNCIFIDKTTTLSANYSSYHCKAADKTVFDNVYYVTKYTAVSGSAVPAEAPTVITTLDAFKTGLANGTYGVDGFDTGIWSINAETGDISLIPQ